MRPSPGALSLFLGGAALLGCLSPGEYRPASEHAPARVQRASAGGGPATEEDAFTPRERRRRSLWLNAGMLAFTAAYGVAFWDWGTSSFHVEREDYLGADTKHGGADKFG